MKRNVVFVLLIIVEAISVCWFSVTKVDWNFMKDIVLSVIIINLIITVVVIFIGKKTNKDIGDNSDKIKKISIMLIVLIMLKVIVNIYVDVYTNILVKDVENMYSTSFLEDINSFDELYDALNINDKEKKILIDNDHAMNDWVKEKNSNPINYVMYLNPWFERIKIEGTRIQALSNINASKINYKNSFKKYKEAYSKLDIRENDFVNLIKTQKEEYIQHLIILFIVTTSFEIFWLFLLIKLEPRKL